MLRHLMFLVTIGSPSRKELPDAWLPGVIRCGRRWVARSPPSTQDHAIRRL